MGDYAQAEAGLPQEDLGLGLSNKLIRNKFVQKVYAILSLQFFLTVGICALFIYV